MTNLVDSYLLFRVRTKQDPEAFARLYDRYVGAIYRFAVLKLPTTQDAEDITSETFVRMWSHIRDQKPITHFRALLYQIARNLIADRYRQTVQYVSLDAAVTFEGSEPSTGVQVHESDRGKGQRLIESRADFSLLMRQLERLKEDYRDVLMLRLVDGLPFTVIGDILEKSVGNVRVIYHRALKALKELEDKP